MINLVFDKFDGDQPISNSMTMDEHVQFSYDRFWNDFQYLLQILEYTKTPHKFIKTSEYVEAPNSYYITEPHICAQKYVNNYWYDLSMIATNDNLLELFRSKALKLVFIFAIEAHIEFGDKQFLTVNKDYGDIDDNMFSIIHSFSEKWKIPQSQVYFVSGNFLIEQEYNKWFKSQSYSEKINVCSFEIFKYTVLIENRGYVRGFHNKIKRKHYFTCLNRYIKPHRMKIVMHLHQNNFLDQGLVSLHEYQFHSELPPDIPQDLIDMLPLVVDFQDEQIFNDHSCDNRHLYDNSYFSIIGETLFSYDEVEMGFITEKTFKAIINLHPFLLVGNIHTLRRLKELGFETFDGYINESYDDADDKNRMKLICDEITRLCNMNWAQIHDWYGSMADILLHNQQHMLNNHNDIKLLLDNLKK